MKSCDEDKPMNAIVDSGLPVRSRTMTPSMEDNRDKSHQLHNGGDVHYHHNVDHPNDPNNEDLQSYGSQTTQIEKQQSNLAKEDKNILFKNKKLSQ